jgi:hypothetical protein
MRYVRVAARGAGYNEMSLCQHPNDTAREARAGIWIFTGRYPILSLVCSAAAGLGIFNSTVNALDWPFALGLSLLPFVCCVLFVWRFINGKPKSYFEDWLLWHVWKLKTAAYLAGAKDRPSTLWIGDRVPKHPKAY